MIEGSLEEQAQFIEGLEGIDTMRHSEWGITSKLVHGYDEHDSITGGISTPIHMSSTFAHPSFDGSTGFMYSRCGNPTRLELENTIALLEGGKKAWAFSSGMSAIACLLKLFSAGDHILVSDDLYGGTYRLFTDVYARYGLEFDYVDFTDQDEIERCCKDTTKALFIETPTNPTMKVVDIAQTAEIAHAHDALFIVDNTLMTPYLQRPISLGADIVVHSGTKFLCGHNDVTAGFLVVADSSHIFDVFNMAMSEGSLLSPMDSWLMLRSIKTLSLRMERHQQNAIEIARYLKANEHVRDVYYIGCDDHPGHDVHAKQASGFGAIVSFRVDVPQRVLNTLERIKLISYAESLGGVESLMTFPLMQTHGAMPQELRDKLGIDERLLRISVGVEDACDLIADLEQALA